MSEAKDQTPLSGSSCCSHGGEGQDASECSEKENIFPSVLTANAKIPARSHEVLACPFCKYDVAQQEFAIVKSLIFRRHYVICDECDASGPSGETCEQAIELWNRASRLPTPEGSASNSNKVPPWGAPPPSPTNLRAGLNDGV